MLEMRPYAQKWRGEAVVQKHPRRKPRGMGLDRDRTSTPVCSLTLVKREPGLSDPPPKRTRPVPNIISIKRILWREREASKNNELQVREGSIRPIPSSGEMELKFTYS